MKELYELKKKFIPFIYTFEESLLDCGTAFYFYCNKNEFLINLTTKDFSRYNEIKEIILTFEIVEDLIYLKIGPNEFKNEIFNHLNFQDNLVNDLDFLSEIIYNSLIPKYKLSREYSKIFS